MRVWHGFVLGILLVPLAIMLACPAQAATMSGRASTVLEWYDDPDEDTAVPVYQYLQFSLMDLGGKGYNFKIYGRVADDFADEVDIDSRLYYAYLEKRGLIGGKLDFRLGRQFISTTAGASLLDGLRLDYRFLDNYQIKLYGGGDVTYYDNYDVDSNGVFGAEVGVNCSNCDLAVNASYLQKWHEGVLGQELAGIDATWAPLDFVWLYGDYQYDILSERTSYALGGGKLHLDDLTFRAEYLYSLPVFMSTSIYSVFAVDEYEEILAEVTWRIRPGLQTFLRLTHEMYVEFEDADVIEAGLEKLRRDKFYGYLTGVYRMDDDGQDLKGFKVYGNYQVMPRFSCGLGANVDVLEREIDFFDTDDSDQDETTSTRLWADAKLVFTDSLNVEAKYEYIESDLWDSYNRGRVRLNFLF